MEKLSTIVGILVFVLASVACAAGTSAPDDSLFSEADQNTDLQKPLVQPPRQVNPLTRQTTAPETDVADPLDPSIHRWNQ